MPTLNIGGRKVKVGDEFLTLSPEDQNAMVTQIASSLPADDAPKAADRGALGQMGAFATGALQGIPIVGPAVDAGTDRIAAFSKSVSGGDEYGKELERIQRIGKEDREANPITTIAGNVLGGVGGVLPVAATARGAQLLGMSGTLPEMVRRGALSGAVIGGADAAVRGENPITGAEVGGVVSGAAPLVGRAIGGAVQGVRGLMTPRAAAVPQEFLEVGERKIPMAPHELSGDPEGWSQANILGAGARGEAAQQQVSAFKALRDAEILAADTDIAARLNPKGAALRTSPQNAAELVSDNLAEVEVQRLAQEAARRAAVESEGALVRGGASPYDAAETVGAGVAGRSNAAKADYRAKYDELAVAPGAVDGSLRTTLADQIGERLAVRDPALYVDPQTSAVATSALKMLNDTVGGGIFKNAAARAGGAPAAAPVGPVAQAAAAVDTTADELRAKYGDSVARKYLEQQAQNAGSGVMDRHSVALPSGGSVEVQPRVVEASSLKTSADAGYDASLQPRNRARAASDAQVNDIANNLNPSRLGVSSEADRGAPIIGADGMVESGNGRMLALRKAYEQGGESAAKYREWLQSQGVDVSQFKNPVLVRERVTQMTPDERKAFTVAANQSSTLSMSAPERALADARLVTPESLSLIRNPADLGSVENRDFVRSFVGRLPQAEQGALMTASGDLSSEGLARVRNAVLGKAYGDTPILARIAESTNDEIKGISNALVATAPEWAALREGVKSGFVPANLDVTDDLLDAVQRTAAIRGKGVSLNESRSQLDAFAKPSDESDAIQRLFYQADGKSAAPASQVANALRNYAQEASKVDASPGLGLGLAPVTARDILETTAAKVGAPKVLAKEVTEKAEQVAAKAVAEEAAAAETITPLTLRDLDAARKRLAAMMTDAKKAAQGGGSADTFALGRIIDEFDNVVEETLKSGKFSGDATEALRLLGGGREAFARYKQVFSKRPGADPVGSAVEKIIGRHADTGATPAQIASLSYEGPNAPLVAVRLRSILGETSPEWGAYKQGLRAHVEGNLSDSVVQRADRIDAFLNGTKGKALADKVLSADESKAWATYSRNLRGLDPPELNSVDKVIAKLSGRNGNPPATANEIIAVAMKEDGAGGNPNVLAALKTKVTPETWDGLRQAVWQKLTTRGDDALPFGPQALYGRLSKFLNDKGQQASKVLYSPEELALMRQMMGVYKRMIPVEGTTNPSGTTPMLAKLVGKTNSTLMPLLGFANGGMVGAAVGALAERGIAWRNTQKAVREAEKLFYGQQPVAPRGPAGFSRVPGIAAQGAAPALTN